MNPESFARRVDDAILDQPPGREPARLFAANARGEDGVVLTLLWSGYTRELPAHLVPPASTRRRIALDSSAWASPMDEGRPSAHPLRRRVHHTR